MKRLEIIIGSYELSKVIDILESENANGYTVISDVIGRGKHGKRIKDEITDVNRRSLVICVENEIKIEKIILKMKKLKDRYSLKVFVSNVSDEI